MRTWVRPQAVVEVFAANDYVAACGDSGKVYKFVCDAPGGIVTDMAYIVSDDGTVNTLYHPCGETHEASVSDDFINGRLIANLGFTQKRVIIWKGENGDNCHVTSNLDIDSWEVTKS